MTTDIENADWENDPALLRLRIQFEDGEISHAEMLHFGKQFMQAAAALGPKRWKLLNGPIEPGTEGEIEEALAILNERAGIPTKPRSPF